MREGWRDGATRISQTRKFSINEIEVNNQFAVIGLARAFKIGLARAYKNKVKFSRCELSVSA